MARTPRLFVKRVLIVSPAFAPSNAADSHRVRQSLPYYRDAGWEPTVLAVDPDEVAAPQDPLLLATVPADVRVVRTGAVPRVWTGRVGIGSLEARALVSVARAGGRLLHDAQRRGEPFDLVFFSTTAMGFTALGPRWQRMHGVPFVIDLQDPWLSDYHDRDGAPPPPGGVLKYGLSQRVARTCEPYVLRHAAHVLSVSPAYPETLVERYPDVSPSLFTVLPFGAPERDFEVLDTVQVDNPVFDPGDDLEHWAYVGRAGGDMDFALDALFAALASARAANPSRYDRVRLHFVGTTYAEGDRAAKMVEPVAARHGVADLVDERPHRIPYFEALQILRDADALVIPGSDDPGYTASKLYPYILARRPLLALFHEASTVVDVIRETEAGTVVTFASGEPVADVAARLGAAWLDGPLPAVGTDWVAFEPYTACAAARRQADVFNAAVALAAPR